MAGSLFANSLGGGVRVGSTLADLFQQGQDRRQLSELGKLLGQGQYEQVGAELLGMGRVGEGLAYSQVPYKHEQQALQREFQNQQFQALNQHRQNQAAFQQEQAAADNAFRERSFEADQGYRGATLGLKQAELAQDIADAKKPNFDDENKFSKDFQAVTKDFRAVRDAYTRIVVSAKDASPAGDLALIFNYMKALDPGSVVRESEFATAAASGAFGERIKAAVNRITSGERLSDEMRADFVDRGKKLHDAALQQYEKTATGYKNRARAYGFDPTRVVQDFTSSGIPALNSVVDPFRPPNERSTVGQVAPPPAMAGPRSAAANGKPTVEPINEIDDLVNRYAD